LTYSDLYPTRFFCVAVFDCFPALCRISKYPQKPKPLFYLLLFSLQLLIFTIDVFLYVGMI